MKTFALILLAVVALAVLAAGALWARIAFEPEGRTLEELADREVTKIRPDGQGEFALVVGLYKDGRVWTKGYGRVDPTAPDGLEGVAARARAGNAAAADAHAVGAQSAAFARAAAELAC